MKVSAFAPLLLAASAFAASARSNALKSRQASMKRGLVDVCVGLDLDVDLLDILPGGKPLVAGHLDLCLCLSVLPEFCKSNPVGQNVANLLGGEDKAHDFFSNLISSQPGHQTCHYPEHCEPICDIQKPCHFGCKDGFIPDNSDHPTQCICPAPHTVCNGVCGDFPHGCASPTPTPKRRNVVSGPAPTPVVSTGGPKNADDIITLLLKQGLIANVLDVAWIKEGLIAALRVGGVHGKPCQDFLNLLLKQGAIVGVPDILTLWERLGLGLSLLKRGAPKSADDIVALLLKQGLIANVADIVRIKEGLIAALRVGGINGQDCHDFLNLLIIEGAIVHVANILDLYELLGLSLNVLKRGGEPTAHDLLDLLAKQGLIADVAHLLIADEGLIAFLHLGPLSPEQCDNLLLLLLDQGLILGVYDLLGLKERLGLALSVLRRGEYPQVDAILNKIVVQGLLVDVKNLAIVEAGLLALVRVGELYGKPCDDFLLVLLQQGLFVNVANLLALKEKLGLALSVL